MSREDIIVGVILLIALFFVVAPPALRWHGRYVYRRRLAARTPKERMADAEAHVERCMPGFMAAWREREAERVKEGDQSR